MRIEFIDVAKGIGILLVIMVHVGIPEPFIGAYAAKVSIFFFLAGLFFVRTVNKGGYLLKKARSILVPFCIYYIISYIIFYSIIAISPNLITGYNTFSITDLFTQSRLFNGPIWFLLSLFEVEAMFYIIYIFIKKEWIRSIIVFMLATIGFILSETKVSLPFWIDTSLVALMYFYFGYIVSLSDVISRPLKTRWLIVIAIVSYGLFLLMPVSIGMSVNAYSNCYLAVSSGALIILFILIISKMLSRASFLAWFGSNSLVILCTHHLVYRPFKSIQLKMGLENPYILFLLTIIVEIPIILFINRFVPILAGKVRCTNKTR